MKTIEQLITEAKEPTVKELGHRCKQVAYDMIKQIALGGYEHNEFCKGIRQADEKELTHMMEVIIDAVGWKGSLEKTIMDTTSPYLSNKLTNVNVDDDYKWVKSVLNRKQLSIYKAGRSTGSDKTTIVSDLYLSVVRFAWKEDKGAVEDLLPEKYSK